MGRGVGGGFFRVKFIEIFIGRPQDSAVRDDQ